MLRAAPLRTLVVTAALLGSATSPATGGPAIQKGSKGDASSVAATAVTRDATEHTRAGQIRERQRRASADAAALRTQPRRAGGRTTALAATGSISGRVRGTDGVGANTVRVEVSTNGSAWTHGTGTQADGSYRISGLADGNYFLRFTRVDAQTDYVTTHLRSGSALRMVPVTGGGATTAGDVAMTTGHTVSSSLTLPAMTNPTAEDQVFLALYPAGSDTAVGATTVPVSATSYAIHGVPAGTYYLAATGIGRANIAPSTQEITVTDDVTRSVALTTGAQVTGKVLTSAGAAASGQVVCFEGDAFACDVTDSAGAYTLRSLPAAAGNISVSQPASEYDDASYFPGVPLPSQATEVATTLAAVKTLAPIRLAARATVSGSIAGAPTDPFVSIIDGDGRIVAGGYGRTFSASVPPTPVQVYAGDYEGSMVGRWWNNTTDRTRATRIALTPGSRRTGLNFSLSTTGGAIISSTVPQYLWSRYPSLHVSATTAQGDFVKGADVGAKGVFTLRGLAAGTYTLTISNLTTDSADTKLFDATATMTVATGARANGAVWRWPASAYQTYLQTGTPTIKGTPTVGSTLTAASGTWVPFGNTLKYQWLADGAPISGATTSTLKVPAVAAGKRLSVRVTGSQYLYRPVTRTSAATVPVVR